MHGLIRKQKHNGGLSLAIHCEDIDQIRLINVISYTGQERELEYLNCSKRRRVETP